MEPLLRLSELSERHADKRKNFVLNERNVATIVTCLIKEDQFGSLHVCFELCREGTQQYEARSRRCTMLFDLGEIRGPLTIATVRGFDSAVQ
ncbi:hypothetical protein PHSY_006359 [Pseudozyma hubeiensis SY62]|uniref:Uncharacterized protein n=1 Tax=Pseudozyma hubeiensis (strain SY62) TaxID=1305764 RepID=R9PBP3_PSEHS|nr:hypothetical protein PHSY_006359 [Pseudozyma hubeiensis SY62]GAC98764.1 hypothetical protein PHSY_006359 [Pseudozyma hubeiensis SY62]